MARLKIKIYEHKTGGPAKVKFSMTNDVAGDIIATLKEVFELEMLTASVKQSKTETVLSFKTKNYERVTMLRQGAIAMYFNTTCGKSDN